MAKIDVGIILRIISAIFLLVAAALISSRIFRTTSTGGGGGGGGGGIGPGDGPREGYGKFDYVMLGRRSVTVEDKCGRLTYIGSVNALLAACASYFVILAIFFVMHVSEQEVDNIVEGAFLIVGCLYTLIGGILILMTHTNCQTLMQLDDKFMAGGVMALLAAILMLFDILIAFGVFK